MGIFGRSKRKRESGEGRFHPKAGRCFLIEVSRNDERKFIKDGFAQDSNYTRLAMEAMKFSAIEEARLFIKKVSMSSPHVLKNPLVVMYEDGKVTRP